MALLSASPVFAEECQTISEQGVADLFERWNTSLQTGQPEKVVENYADDSILLPTLSNQPRVTKAEKLNYFEHFLTKHPSGTIDFRHIERGCNMVVDAGLYTFTFAPTGEQAHGRYSFTYRWNGQNWLISSHHSSLMPETSH